MGGIPGVKMARSLSRIEEKHQIKKYNDRKIEFPQVKWWEPTWITKKSTLKEEIQNYLHFILRKYQ